MSDVPAQPNEPLKHLAPWYQQYLAYDEDSLITYANAGSYRRANKDLANDKIQLRTADDDKLEFDNDGQTVTLTANGLAKANCSCPAHTACKHIVASVLKLQSLLNHAAAMPDIVPNDTPDATGAPNSNVNPSNDNDALTEILALDIDKLAKKIGKSQRQKALNFALTYPLSHEHITVDKRAVITHVSVIDEDIRYLSQAGFDGMLSNIDVDRLAWHWYVLSEIQRLHDKPSALVQQAYLAQSQAIAEQQQLSESALALVDTVGVTLTEFVEHGLAHLDDLSVKRLFMLSISARSDGLYRLAARLRQLSGFINRWLNHDETLKERQLLISLADTFAYLQQLKTAKNQPFIALKGQLRRTYETENYALTLYPLGGRWWRTLSGARGLTLYFWESSQQQAIEVTTARAANQDPNFNQHTAWQNSLWVISPAQLMSHISQLTQPRFNEQGQLASSGSTATTQATLDDHYIETLQKIAIDDWRQLNQKNPLVTDDIFQESQIRLLAIKSSDKDSLIIDEVAQCIWWQVYDQHNNILRLTLNWQTYQSDSMRKIKQLENLDMAKIRMILVHQSIDGNAVSLEPISIIMENPPKPANKLTQVQSPKFALFNLDFDEAARLGQQKSSSYELITGRITQLLNQKKRRQQIYQPSSPTTLSERLCEPILQVLESAVGVGRLMFSDNQRQTLQSQAHLANDAGMTILADSLNSLLQPTHAIAAEDIFKIAYLCDICLKLQIHFPVSYAKS